MNKYNERMNGKAKGNFVVISGLIVALCIGLVTYVGWHFCASSPEPQKPVIVGSGKPSILGPALSEEAVTEIAQNTGANKAMTEYPESVRAPGVSGDIPKQIAESSEKGTWIYIDKAAYKLYLVDGNTIRNTWGIAVGKVRGNKQKSGDNRTPEGTFPVQQIQNASSWTHDFKDGKGVIKNAYGPWFIRLKTSWSGIGIHGTHDPDSIGTCATEGCIRLKNDELEELKKSVSVGMKVVIAPN